MPLKVLITNLVLADRTGTEVVVEQLADGLRRAGHQACVWTSRAGAQAEAMRARGHLVVERLEQLPWRPDVIHGHHNVMTLTALAGLPGVPAVFTCHDADSPFDAAPRHPRVRAWLAVDALCRDRLICDGVPPQAVAVLPNAVDAARHPPRPALPARPVRALALGKQAAHLPALRAACADAGLALDELGHGVGRVSDRLPELLADYDLVFATARGALEAAFVGCAVVVCDARGLAGLLTSETLPAWRALNFGRGALAWPVSGPALARALAAYDAADAARVSRALRAEAGLDEQVRVLQTLYRRAMDRPLADPQAEAAAVARFLEDFLPTYALERPWRRLAQAVSAGAVDPLAPLAAQVRDAVIERLDGALRSAQAAGPDGAEALRVGLAARWFPPERFHYVLGGPHAAPGPARRALADSAGVLVYGPYDRLPAGRWEVSFALGWEDVEADAGEVVFDVTAGAGRRLAERRFEGGPPRAPHELTLAFEHDRADEPLEFRVGAAGFSGGRLAFAGATVRPLG